MQDRPELLSACCGAGISEMDFDGNGRCVDCKENTSVDTTCCSCNVSEMTFKKYLDQYGICEDCAWTLGK